MHVKFHESQQVTEIPKPPRRLQCVSCGRPNKASWVSFYPHGHIGYALCSCGQTIHSLMGTEPFIDHVVPFLECLMALSMPSVPSSDTDPPPSQSRH